MSTKISNDVMKLLQEVAEMAAVKATRKKQIARPGINYFKLTEKLLYQLQDLKYYLADEETYIENYLSEDKPRKSKDIVCFSSSNHGDSVVEVAENMRQKAVDAMQLSKAFVARIEMALGRLDAKEFELIEDMYLNKIMTSEELARKYHYADKCTLYRKRKKPIERVQLFLFGVAGMNI